MKKLLLFTTILIAFASCSKNDDSNNDINTPVKDYKTLILGNWKIKKRETIYSKDRKIENYIIDNCEKQNNITFYENNKYVYNSYEFYDNKCHHSERSANYSIQDNKLMSKDDEGSYESKIVKLTKDELIIDNDDDDDLDNDGLPEIDRVYFTKDNEPKK